ncbi:T9SS type A sorting domain-containing protein [Winogradskyella psychrotolerans]|uniref:T9SS type A sorting domain-containing protein n=1 Tax=Winogradskyella psychrotolerans TaxID=1344585 RepID=UPI001C06882C|nr:T9SS type A sorting domain-containing protein [Winogradskyella psychrotolerans]MBU2926745.1 T9SS type A sorting domain-containing protein [Winogradskyella psychrotolerans]
MKKLLRLFILIPFLSFGQVQIGQDIDGEASEDFSGHSVSLSNDGSIIAIGAPYNDGNGYRTGHVRVYENQNGSWVQIGQDIDGEANADFSGYSVSLSSDGSIVAIGSSSNDGNGNSSGHVRVYGNQNGSWVQVGQDIDGEAAYDESGKSISLSSDGSIIAIGASENSGNGNSSGHVRVYENQNGSWVQVGQDINGEAAYDESGISVSLSSDGSIVAIGAPYNDGNANNSGHVRVFENVSGTWIQVGQDIDGETFDDESGWSISLSSDGSIIAIGAPENNGNYNNSGHVRVYENQNGSWIQVGQDIDGEAAGDASGYSVSLSDDGNIIAIGAVGNDGNDENDETLNHLGHVRVYYNVSDTWIQLGQDMDGEAHADYSGYSVSLSSDGSIVAIGALFNNDNGLNSGHVRVYDLSTLLSTKSFKLDYFKIYPNPTKNQFTIQLEDSTELQNVKIYNNLGQLVLISNKSIINSSNLASGLYLVEIETNKGKSSKKLIIE